ncbi:MAG TPA: hypothetical protein VIV12_04615, partial [Streptosporangiaceae bacterium]
MRHAACARKGSGNFIGFAPATARLTGVEVEPVTAAIAAALYPDAQIRCESFAETRAPAGSFDLAIGNVPFGNLALHDPRYNPGRQAIHNHFIIKSLHLTRPGGLVAVLTSRYTMDARNPAARREIAALADLVGAIRLPSGAHQRAAGTAVVTDLLILRRREHGRDPSPAAWEQARLTEVDGAQVPVNEYFLAQSENVLGEFEAVHGAYRAGDLTVRPAGDTIASLQEALERMAASASAQRLRWAPPGPAQPSPGALQRTAGPAEPDGYLRACGDGTFAKVVDGVEQPHPVPRTQAGELRSLLGLRDTARALLNIEA